MNQPAIKLPVYTKLAQVIAVLIGCFYILYVGQEIIIPLVLALLIAILLNPVVNLLTVKIHRVIAILITEIAAILLLAFVAYFIISQVNRFSGSSTDFSQKFSDLVNILANQFSDTFDISKEKVNGWISKLKEKGLNGSFIFGQTLSTITGIIIYFFLLPVYVFMFLFYKTLLLEFISRLFRRNNHDVVAEVLVETKILIQKYLVGLLIEACLVAALNSIGLMIIGLEYAILIGIIGALLNIIPYIGGLIAISIPMLLAVATKTPADALWVLVVYLVVQFIDNNFILPRIVASRVKLNALVSIVVVLVGGALWGIAGMFLAIPLTAIIKVIRDRVEPLTPFGFLLGDNQPEIGKIIFKFRKPVKTEKKTVV